MRQISLFILVLFLSGCSATSQINSRIDKSQKFSLKDSPFETAKGMIAELKKQKKYRIQYENDLMNLIESHPNDTIILTENYDFICFGCPADYVQIFIKNKLYSYRKDITEKNYKNTLENLTDNLQDTTGYFHDDITELLIEIKNGKSWNKNPEKYGTDECFDGGHTFYTIFYPSGKIESMYMRCWIPKEFRKSD